MSCKTKFQQALDLIIVVIGGTLGIVSLMIALYIMSGIVDIKGFYNSPAMVMCITLFLIIIGVSLIGLVTNYKKGS